MPTGGGKSICFQVPGIIREGITIVISQLIALMQDQVSNLQSKGIMAKAIMSGMSYRELDITLDNAKFNGYKFLYTSPERIQSRLFLERFKQMNVGLIVVDEAHCISEWGHDFRPSFMEIKKLREIHPHVPIIAVTATATPKTRQEIIDRLELKHPRIHQSRFERPNLIYSSYLSQNKLQSVIDTCKAHDNETGIVYCQKRKSVKFVATTLHRAGISSGIYHGGMNKEERQKMLAAWLKGESKVMIATNAFGMGIDKPDVRFVIHHDIPKSLESYYQETGRAGRDGGEGHCLAYYSYKDVEKLEKFMSGKPVAEQEIGFALLQEVVAYAETSISRRKFLLHYFGEEFDSETGEGADMDDNVRNPKTKVEAKDQVKMLLEVVRDTKHLYKSKEVVFTLIGRVNATIKAHRTDTQKFFGCGANYDERYWMALIRQVLVDGLLTKDIETYGILKVSERGQAFIQNPTSFLMSEDHEYSENEDEAIVTASKSSGTADEALMAMLRELRKKVAKKLGVPPFVVFQDPSLEDMALKYPINIDELSNVHGVGEGKAKKYGKDFVELIARYVEDNDIIRPDDLVVKSTGANSSNKLYIIQNIDRKLSLEDIAKAKGMNMDTLLKEMEQIVYSGTKLNIDYWINEILDEDQQEEIHDYFMDSESDKIEEALKEFDGDYDIEELRLMRIKFISEVAN